MYDTNIYGKLIYRCLVVPNLNIWGVMVLAGTVYPQHKHSKRDWFCYCAFSLLSTLFRILSNFGPSNPEMFEGLFFVFTDGLWLLTIFSMYGVRPSQPDPNLTYLRFMLIPLFIYSTIYDITYYVTSVNVGLVTATIWIAYSAVVGLFMLNFDVPVDYFRRFVSGHFVQRYHIHLDGNYFSYYVWVIFNLGPGVGLLLAKLLVYNGGGAAATTVPITNDAVIQTLAVQFFSIASCHVAEVVCRRTWDGVSYKLLDMQIYFMFNLVQAALFLQVSPWSWAFLKMAAAQQAANLCKNSATKDLMLWLLGIRSALPLIDKTSRSLAVKASSDVFLEFLALAAAFVLFAAEGASKSHAVPFDVSWQGVGDDTPPTSSPGDMCAATCVGWRQDYGVPPGSYSQSEAGRLTAGKAAAVLASSFALRYVSVMIEARFVRKVYFKFGVLAKSIADKEKQISERKRDEQLQVTKKFNDLSKPEITSWLGGQLAQLFYKEVDEKKLNEKEALKKLTLEEMDRAQLSREAHSLVRVVSSDFLLGG